MQILRLMPAYCPPTMASRPTRGVGNVQAQPAFGASQPKPPEAKALPWYTRIWNRVQKIWNRARGFVLGNWWYLTNPTFRQMAYVSGRVDKKRIATHELGHLLMLFALGHPHFERLSVESNSKHAGAVTLEMKEFLKLVKKDPESAMFHHLAMLYAGDALDFQTHVKGPREDLEDYARKLAKLESLGVLPKNDHGKIRDGIKILVEMNEGKNPACNEAEIIEGCYHVVEALRDALGAARIAAMVDDLVARNTIEGPENIRAFIGQHLNGVDLGGVQAEFNALIKKTQPKKKP